MEMVEVICPHCEGCGLIEHKASKQSWSVCVCTTCNGHGFVQKRKSDGVLYTYAMTKEIRCKFEN